MWRHRIRITITGMSTLDSPVNLHDQYLAYPEHRYIEHVKENETINRQVAPNSPAQQLPILALNEVFIGESLSARFATVLYM